MSRSGSPHHFTQYNSTLYGQIVITLASNFFPSVQLLSEVSDESQSGVWRCSGLLDDVVQLQLEHYCI